MNQVFQFEKLAIKRKFRGWTQHQLFEKSKVSKAAICSIETGKKTPTVVTLARLANALETRIAYFFKK